MEATQKKFDVSLWKAQIKNRIEHREALRKTTLDLLISKLKTCREDIPVDSLYIFGSITRENMFSETSDIDIAVKTIKADISFFKLWIQIDTICETEIDLLDMDECSFSHLIEAQGIKIM
ncbi:MAG: nucleotidyltransferase family protein [Cytophagales bacterium]